MPDTSPVLALPLIQPAQAQKHITHNEALRVLDAVVQLVVLAADQTAPPTGATAGDRYIVASPASGAWTDHADEIALFADGGWSFIVPQAGWCAQVLTPKGAFFFDATAGWKPVGGAPQNLTRLGINAADTTNRLSLSAPATLLNHEGAGHQLKLNKAGSADTASLLYQNPFSGCAEMGLSGSDDFAIKVSADGTTWKTALNVSAATGGMDAGVGLTVGGGAVYHHDNVLGIVTQTAGQPTGALIERDSKPNGRYVRFADGTQICTHTLNVTFDTASNLGVRWNFPISFVAPAMCSGTLLASSLTADVTPPITGITGVMRGDNNAGMCNFLVHRITGGTDFVAGDMTSIQVTAIGRWF